MIFIIRQILENIENEIQAQHSTDKFRCIVLDNTIIKMTLVDIMLNSNLYKKKLSIQFIICVLSLILYIEKSTMKRIYEVMEKYSIIGKML